MVIIFKGYGNHSNRLFQAIHVEAFCLEHKMRFYNPSFKDMAALFKAKSHFFDGIVCFFLRIMNKVGWLKSPDFAESELYSQYFLKKKLAFYKGWSFRAESLTNKYREFFILKYSLLPKYYESNNLYNLIMKTDRTRFILVGIHIRWGDYRTWEGGKHYFPEEVYKKYMDNFSTELKRSTGKQPLFIIFSNEKTSFVPSEDILLSENEWYIDQFIMSRCNYLIGPPSTFTVWASYIGGAKYFHIKDDSGQISTKDFISQEF